MSLIELNQPAPDFTLADVTGNSVSLSQFKGKKHAILVLNRAAPTIWRSCVMTTQLSRL